MFGPTNPSFSASNSNLVLAPLAIPVDGSRRLPGLDTSRPAPLRLHSHDLENCCSRDYDRRVDMYNAGDAIESAGNSTSGHLRGGFGQPGQLMYGPSSACSPDFGHRRHPGPEARRGPVGEFRGPASDYSRPRLLAPSTVRSGQHARRQGSVADRGADGGSLHEDRSSC